jgi:predicted CXXCH cytochrome family protein
MASSNREPRQRFKPTKSEGTSSSDNGSSGGGSSGRGHNRAWWIAAAIVLVFAVATAGWMIAGSALSTFVAGKPGSAAAATYVGSETCAGCHQAETRLWQTSQHKKAMDHANDRTVLGDFSGVTFEYHGVTSRFFRKDGKFFVETDGPDGKLAPFEIKYTFGLDPLQQYLIAFSDGRIQALSIAWDSRPKDKGGQRWFHLYPDENIRHDDVLHWTKLNQNWNFMCAECHSTGVRKNYDAATDSFKTTWSEISVGCETCHGTGSDHVAWARSQASWWPFGKHEDRTKGLAVRFDERANVTWTADPQTGKPQRSIAPALLRIEVETCGFCHARGGAFSEDWVPGRWLSNTHRVSPFERRLFHADGQTRDVEEPYNYQPFKQSAMFAKGVTCSDCHEPHSAALRAPGNGVCVQCHAADKFDTAAHRHHDEVKPALACTSCHMQARNYMIVDPRHDHSFRVPRPDVSVKLGTPNACNNCHRDQSPQWAATAVERWYGPKRTGFQNYAEAFHAAWTEQPDAEMLLAAVASNGNTPAYVRAGALAELNAFVSPANLDLARKGLADPDPMVRIGALDMLEGIQVEGLWPLLSPLLSDSVRGVRLRAVSLLAAVPAPRQPPADRDRFDRAAAEFIAAQRFNADRPEARTALGAFHVRRGNATEAEKEFTAALKLSPQYAPAAINLADLYRQRGHDGDSVKILQDTIGVTPQDAGLHHALGLAFVRLKRNDEALAELNKASELDPERSRYAYVYAVALHSGGRVQDAVAVLKGNLARHPNDRDTLLALISFSRDSGDTTSALDYAQKLAQISPADPGLTALIDALKRQVDSAPR